MLTVWVLSSVRAGVMEVIGVSSDIEHAQQRAHAIIAAACGQALGRPPAWTPLPSGGTLLIYGRDRHSFQFRADPWLMDAQR